MEYEIVYFKDSGDANRSFSMWDSRGYKIIQVWERADGKIGALISRKYIEVH